MKRKVPYREEVRTAIIEVAERLFGRWGLEGVSLRQIAKEGGFRNNVVVQYHFGDKEGLVRAIFHHRLPDLDRRRAELLAEAREQGREKDPRVLMSVLLRPIAELVDAERRHNYAAFLFSLQQFDYLGSLRDGVSDRAPVTHQIADTLRQQLGDMDDRLFTVRNRATFAAFFTVLMYIDQTRERGELRPGEEQRLVDDAISLVTTGLCLPADAAPQPLLE